jgi:hypothetical protein
MRGKVRRRRKGRIVNRRQCMGGRDGSTLAGLATEVGRGRAPSGTVFFHVIHLLVHSVIKYEN